MSIFSLQIQPATTADLVDITRIEQDASDETKTLAYSKDLLSTLVKYTDVLVVDGVVAGFCIHHMLTKRLMKEMDRLGFDFARNSAKGRCAGACHITNIAVDKNVRNRGFGQLMVRAALKKHSKHKYVRYTYTGGFVHCIEKVLRSESYVLSDPIVKEAQYSNGKDALRFVFKKM